MPNKKKERRNAERQNSNGDSAVTYINNAKVISLLRRTASKAAEDARKYALKVSGELS